MNCCSALLLEKGKKMQNYSEEAILTIAHSMFCMARIVREMRMKSEEERQKEFELLAHMQGSVEGLVMQDVLRQN